MSRSATGSIRCGWCMTGNHEDCKTQIVYYDKVWECSCEKCHPQRVDSKDAPSEQEEGMTNEEVVQEPIQDKEAEAS